MNHLSTHFLGELIRNCTISIYHLRTNKIHNSSKKEKENNNKKKIKLKTLFRSC